MAQALLEIAENLLTNAYRNKNPYESLSNLDNCLKIYHNIKERSYSLDEIIFCENRIEEISRMRNEIILPLSYI
jgi:hypothetical protein